LGGDRDVHGCKGSAGYTYSQIRNNCVRVFDQKIKLKEVGSDKSYTTMTAVIFSKDMKRAEVFIPEGAAKSIILDKEGKAKSGKAEAILKKLMFWFHTKKRATRLKKMM
jgi:ribosome-binding factor A